MHFVDFAKLEINAEARWAARGRGGGVSRAAAAPIDALVRKISAEVKVHAKNTDRGVLKFAHVYEAL